MKSSVRMLLPWSAAANRDFASLIAAAESSLIAEPLGKLVVGRGELGKRINEASHHQRRNILHDVHQNLLLEEQMHGAPEHSDHRTASFWHSSMLRESRFGRISQWTYPGSWPPCVR